jgi:hypothetical protein
VKMIPVTWKLSMIEEWCQIEICLFWQGQLQEQRPWHWKIFLG